jgi:hypothetical protein
MKKQKYKITEQIIREHILGFYDAYKEDPLHRFKSWEDSYLYFRRLKRNPKLLKKDFELACLHLGFYLASWGMYRGSSFLLKKSFLIHTKPIKELLRRKYDCLRNIDLDYLKKPETLDILFKLKDTLTDAYLSQLKDTNGISDTLVTKILLGTLGCTPAFDRFFKEGCKKKKVHPYSNFSKRSIEALINFYQDYSCTFESINKKIKKYTGISYPPMKLVDMFFWSVGSNKKYYLTE